MRLIDADALMRDIEKYHLSDGKFQHWVEVQPTIEERKTGEWIRTDKTDIVDGKYINWTKWNCSECGVEKKIGWAKGVKFCPNCGADMRGE